MSIYNISYDQKAIELLPPDKRTEKQVSWVRAMYGQLKYLRDQIFTYYKTGIEYYNMQYVANWEAGYAGGSGYSINNPVLYGEAVYVSLIDGNISVPTSSDWVKIQDNFIGVDERVMFNANKLVLEYAMNKRFSRAGAVFRQPPSLSDIYIVKNSMVTSVFILGYTEAQSSISYAGGSNEVIIDDYTFNVFYNFTIMVKSSVYYQIDASGDPILIDKIIRNFVDRYNTIGLTYNIETY
jgi:hypothetical protein